MEIPQRGEPNAAVAKVRALFAYLPAWNCSNGRWFLMKKDSSETRRDHSVRLVLSVVCWWRSDMEDGPGPLADEGSLNCAIPSSPDEAACLMGPNTVAG